MYPPGGLLGRARGQPVQAGRFRSRSEAIIARHRRPPGPRPGSLAYAAAAALLVGCGASDGNARAEPGTEAQVPLVITSIFPLGDLAARVGGDDVRVDVLVPPRADPATFEPSPRQMQALTTARAFLVVGGGMDEWMVSVPGSLDGIPVVRMNDGIPLRAGGHGEGTGDPHTWLDPILVRDRWLPAIVEALVRARPEARTGLEARGAQLADSLTALDAWMAERLAPVRSRAFIATHSAWQYLAHRYGVIELGAIYGSPGREPSSRELAGLLERARAAHVSVVFTEPQLGESGARALAEELSVGVAVLDPLGGPGLPGRDSYFGMMRYNTEQISSALRNDR
ncbi:MAG: zinc ABC transporter substrate-binding protein [Gemmatimonadetes bacterium]|nr:zinc ABC transporter substrate-binding protein [Gemmatimonadota bacterium]